MSVCEHEEEYKRIDELIQKMPSVNDFVASFRSVNNNDVCEL